MRTRLIYFFIHLTGWILFFSLILAFLAGPPQGRTGFFSHLFTWPFLLFAFIYLFLFYLNYTILVPGLFIKKKYIFYFGIICLLFAAVYFIKPFDRLISMNPQPLNRGFPGNEIPPPPNNPLPVQGPVIPWTRGGPGGRDINSIILFVTIWSLSTAVPVIRRYRLTEQRALQAEKERADAELSFLKAQINPHFLFNTLNNIYSMAVIRDDNTAPSVMKLSNILRYITDEAGQNFVPLESEIACMKDYIDLQRMRFGPKMNVDLQLKGDITDKKIAPLLLMTFVENVFKYGISSHEPSPVMIKLAVQGDRLHFFSQNRIFASAGETERTGIGIDNARLRLKHLYPGDHLLDIAAVNGSFTVQLDIPA